MYVSVLKDINEFFNDLSLELGQSIMEHMLERHVTEKDQCLKIISGMFDEFSIDRRIYLISRRPWIVMIQNMNSCAFLHA